MIKPVFISEFENIDSISNNAIIFNEDNFLDYTFDSTEDITIYVKSNDAKSFLSKDIQKEINHIVNSCYDKTLNLLKENSLEL